jgi:hypothetical protein
VPITKIEFFLAPDVHLVRGQNTNEDLRGLIQATPVTGDRETLSNYLNNHNDVAVDFKPTFKIQTTTTTEYGGFGITVDRKTGHVKVAGGTAPNPSPKNFLVEAIITKNTGGVDPKTIAPAFTRVHVHQRVERVWLTPERLTIRARPGSPTDQVGQQFTVRVEFDDAVVADATDSNQLKFSPTSTANEDDGRLKIPDSANPGDVLDVTVTTTALWGNKSFTGHIALLEEWSNEPNAPTAEFVDGLVNVQDGTVSPEEAMNVLFVACGFDQPAQDPFREIATRIVHRLSQTPLFQPFGYLSSSMNFWRVVPPSREAGVNVRPELKVYFQNEQLMAKPLPLPVVPASSMDDWGINDLIYAVGLPVRGDLSLVKDPLTNQPPPDLDNVRKREPDEFTYDALFTRWKSIAEPRPGIDYAQVRKSLAHRWFGLADRTFTDDVDALPAVSVGEMPKLGSNADVDTLNYDFRRNGVEELDRILRRMTAQPNPVDGSVIRLTGVAPDNHLGNLWVIDPFDPATPRNWKFNNRRLTIGLCNSPIGRANAMILTRLEIFMANGPDTVVFDGLPVTRVAGRNALKLNLDVPLAMRLDDPTFEACAHELGHNFMLGDEYSEVAAAYTDNEASLDNDGNLTTEAAVKDANGVVSLDQIKWNWHRIHKSAAFTRPLVARLNGLFHCTVRGGIGLRFAERDKVLLRRRVPDTALGRAIAVVSPIEFEVKKVHKTNINDNSDALNMTIEIQADDPSIDSALMVATFGLGVMYVPVPAPQTVEPARKYLTLIPPAAERILKSTGLTMTGSTCDLNADGRIVHAPVADPEGKLVSTVTPHVVGAYFGGKRHSCGVLRPTGMCMMRDHTLEPEQFNQLKKAPQGISKFCVVCSYVMVDFLDPDQHWRIDRDYATWYPF